MYLSQTNISELRQKFDSEGGFQIALAPMQPSTFLNVKIATDKLYQQLVGVGIKVLVDDRGQKPKNMFEVIEFLGVRHRVVISVEASRLGFMNIKTYKQTIFVKLKKQMPLVFYKI